mmetsp:Transcript_4864/g.13713  ORF Transcript_4864/g.13713 Transcript_4864/m.13713 type:complete len:244 (-) Transcript_4864:850-1581(-)
MRGPRRLPRDGRGLLRGPDQRGERAGGGRGQPLPTDPGGPRRAGEGPHASGGRRGRRAGQRRRGAQRLGGVASREAGAGARRHRRAGSGRRRVREAPRGRLVRDAGHAGPSREAAPRRRGGQLRRRLRGHRLGPRAVLGPLRRWRRAGAASQHRGGAPRRAARRGGPRVPSPAARSRVQRGALPGGQRDGPLAGVVCLLPRLRRRPPAAHPAGGAASGGRRLLPLGAAPARLRQVQRPVLPRE